jgi:uncharacterized protein
MIGPENRHRSLPSGLGRLAIRLPPFVSSEVETRRRSVLCLDFARHERAWAGWLFFVNLLAAFALLACSPALAQTFPPLTGRVTDAANIIPDDREAALSQKLAALEAQSGRQFVVATIPSLEGYEISDYGYRLGRAWAIGSKEKNDGALLIVAPTERKVRIEVGYGLEGILTDGLSSLIIQNEILPKFREGDMPGGIEAGADAVLAQLTLPEDQARIRAAQAQSAAMTTPEQGFGPMIFFGLLFFAMFILPMLTRGARRRGYRPKGMGPVILWAVADALANARTSSGGSSFGGGFSGGGGSFGGGGSSGSW